MHAGFEVDIEDECDALPPMDDRLAAGWREAQMFRLNHGRRRAGLVAELVNQNVRCRVSLAKIGFKILRLHGSEGIENEGPRIGNAELWSVLRHVGVEQAVASDH